MNFKRHVRALTRRFGYDLVSHRSVSSLGSNITFALESRDIDLVIDVGGHRGEYGTYLRQLGYDGFIYSVEPVRESFEALDAVSRRDPKWVTRRLALGKESGTAEIKVMAGSVLSSFRAPSSWGRAEYGHGFDVDHTEPVEVCTLDELSPEIESLSTGAGTMLKIDTQGFEMDVLLGAAESLDRLDVVQAELPVIPLYESAASMDDVTRHLAERGFDPSGWWPVAHDRDLRLIEVDCLFVRRIDRRPAVVA